MCTFKEKVAVVTGGASGLGRALCKALAGQGARVYALDINQEALDILQKEYPEPLLFTKFCDIRQYASIKNVLENIWAAQGRIDYLFNNAGIAAGGEIQLMTSAQWNRVMDINTMGVISGTRIAYAQMVKQGFGHIINTSSLAGVIPVVRSAAYTCSKHAVVGLSLSLAEEAKCYGIKVSVLILGAIDTGIFESAINVEGYDYNRQIHNRWINRMKPEQAAERILKQVAKGRGKILIPGTLRILLFLYRVSPRMTMALMGKMM